MPTQQQIKAKQAFERITEEDHLKADADFKRMTDEFSKSHEGFSLLAAMISQPSTSIHFDARAPAQFMIHAALQLLFITLGQLEGREIKAIWKNTIQTAVGYNPVFLLHYLQLKELMDDEEE